MGWDENVLVEKIAEGFRLGGCGRGYRGAACVRLHCFGVGGHAKSYGAFAAGFGEDDFGWAKTYPICFINKSVAALNHRYDIRT